MFEKKKKPEEPVKTGKPKALFGIFLTQKGSMSEWTDISLTDTFQKAKEGGISVAVWFNDWGTIEPSLGDHDWAFLDYITEKTKEQGFKFSLSLEIVQIDDNPNYPKEIVFTNFDDPQFVNSFKNFIRKLLDRYNGKIEYLWIGQEVDYYLHNHQEQKEPFLTFFQEVRGEVKSINPDITIGVVGNYNLAKEFNETALLQDFADRGDAIALTVYPEDVGGIDTPSKTQDYFNELMALFPGKKVAIYETAWSSQGPNGSEEKQVRYVKEISKVIEKHNFEFFSWYILHDFSEGDNRVVSGGYDVGEEDFLAWHGSLGLLNNDGSEKLVWKTWKEYMLESKN